MSGDIFLNYKLIDSGECEKLFRTPQEAQAFVEGIGKGYFEWVYMYVPVYFSEDIPFDICEGYDEVMEYGR